MEPEPKEKGQRRKLKRVLPKKKKSKINLNNSASVVYYKKVKAALNASLNNTSRASQTLKANNKALAQSLQHVKQELRHALNENGRLKVENQELTMKLLRLENQVGTAPEQATYEQRLQGLKALLNNMSSHLLELGNCVSDGMHLCLVSPRNSQSSASRPQSMEEFKATETEKPDAVESSSSGLSELISDSEMDNQQDEWEEEPFTDVADQNGLGKMTPDMSIIMEQSVLADPQEGMALPEASMAAVPEDPLGECGSKNGCKKLSALTKLPQRVRNGGSSKSSSNEEDESSLVGGSKKTSKTRSGSLLTENKKATERSDGSVAGKAFASKSPPFQRRETFVISKNVDRIVSSAKEKSSSGSLEDITNVQMPDLVSASPMKDDHGGEVFELENSEQVSSQENVNSCVESQSDETKCKSTPTDAETSSGTKGRLKRKSAGKKTESALAKQPKASAINKNRPVPPTNSNKDTEFFVSNPCALNLVHKRVTGSSEGCLDGSKESTEEPPPASSVDQFLAHIKESNRNSTKLASFLVVDDANAAQKSRKSTETPLNVNKSRRSSGGRGEALENETVYFNSDMDFTEVLPQSQSHVTVEEDQGENAKQKSGMNEESSKENNKKKARSKPGPKTALGKAQVAGKDTEDDDNVGTDKKLAVALRVNKPGQMVFAASRKEEDGSRKAIPAKLPTKARSKSKKRMEEMAKNLPQTESDCIFDFHDMTPRPAAAEGKSNQQQGSVFDLSLNDTVSGTATTLASLRQKLNTIVTNDAESTGGAHKRNEDGATGKEKSASSKLLGDAPVYFAPLKDNSSEPEPRPRSSGRSSSRSKESTRSRSRSRSKKMEDVEDVNSEKPGRASRSKSRGRSGKENVDNANEEGTKAERPENTEFDDGSKKNCEEGSFIEIISSDKPQRSARSRSRARKIYTDDEVSSPVSSPKEENTSRGRSSRVKNKVDDEDDEDFVPPSRSKPRGRSRRRQVDKQPIASDTKEEKPVQNRGRSRSRRKVQEDQPPNNDDETHSSTTSTNQDKECESQSEKSTQQTHQPPDEKGDGPQDENINKERDGLQHSNESAAEPLQFITDRRSRHRSKSRSRKLYNEAMDTLNEPFGFSAAVDTADADPQPDSMLEMPKRGRTRSKGIALLNQEKIEDEKSSKDASDETCKSEINASCAAESQHKERVSDKRKLATGHDLERQASPSKKLCKDSKGMSDSDVQETVVNVVEKNKGDCPDEKLCAKEKDTAAVNSPMLKRRKSSLPIPVNQTEGDKNEDSPATMQSKSKSYSKIPEPKSAEKMGKIKYALHFEEVKRKLKEIDQHQESGKDVSMLPVKKSRPLVLPKPGSTAAAASKKPPARSLPNADGEQGKGKAPARSKKGRSQPGSPKDLKVEQDSQAVGSSASAASSAASSPHLSEAYSENADDTDSSSGGKRGRRAAASVSYKEPSLNAKLRRGDPHTSFLHKDQMSHIYKSPKTHRKHGKSDRVDRTALHDLTNQSIQEVSGE